MFIRPYIQHTIHKWHQHCDVTGIYQILFYEKSRCSPYILTVRSTSTKFPLISIMYASNHTYTKCRKNKSIFEVCDFHRSLTRVWIVCNRPQRVEALELLPGRWTIYAAYKRNIIMIHVCTHQNIWILTIIHKINFQVGCGAA